MSGKWVRAPPSGLSDPILNEVCFIFTENRFEMTLEN